jgi:hypothetical protein
MLTIAVSVFGLMLVNWHFDVMSEIAKLSKEAAIVLNDVLKSVLPVPLEWQPSKSIVRLDIKFGADETIVVPDSRAVTAAASGTPTFSLPWLPLPFRTLTVWVTGQNPVPTFLLSRKVRRWATPKPLCRRL